MPRYVYQCPCGERLELSCKVAERDDQHCGGQHDQCPRAKEAGTFTEQLKREEIPPVGAAMSFNWQKWTM